MLMAYAISTAVFGVITTVLGRAEILRPLFKLVPFPVLLGFLTSIGVSLFASAFSTAVPDPVRKATTGGFVSLTDGRSWHNLVRHEAVVKWIPGVFMAVVVYVLQKEWSWRPKCVLHPRSPVSVPPPPPNLYVAIQRVTSWLSSCASTIY